MKRLVLAAVLAMAMPAFAAENSVEAKGSINTDGSINAEGSTHDAEGSTPTAKSAVSGSLDATGAATTEAKRADAAPLTEPERAAPPPAPARPPLTADAVARATFATAIDAREPVDSIGSLESDQDHVYYFSELVGIPGRTVTHRWTHEGETMAEVTIAVGGPRWRAYSSKQLDPSQLGEWKVSVVDESGNVLREDSFVYEAPAPTPEVAASAAPDPGAETPAAPAPSEATPAATPDAAPASPAPGQP